MWGQRSIIYGHYLMKVILIGGHVVSANLQNLRYKPPSGPALDLNDDIQRVGDVGLDREALSRACTSSSSALFVSCFTSSTFIFFVLSVSWDCVPSHRKGGRKRNAFTGGQDFCYCGRSGWREACHCGVSVARPRRKWRARFS